MKRLKIVSCFALATSIILSSVLVSAAPNIEIKNNGTYSKTVDLGTSEFTNKQVERIYSGTSNKNPNLVEYNAKGVPLIEIIKDELPLNPSTEIEIINSLDGKTARFALNDIIYEALNPTQFNRYRFYVESGTEMSSPVETMLGLYTKETQTSPYTTLSGPRLFYGQKHKDERNIPNFVKEVDVINIIGSN